MSFVIEDVLIRDDPGGCRRPVVFDSPHSGIQYPREFRFTCPLSLLRQAEDGFVDELFAAAPDHGATLLAALFPRSFIDVNRAADDLDPEMIDGLWREPLRPGDKSALGMGLIRRLCRPGMPIYDGRLPAAEIADRIDRYYRPYHFQLEAILDSLAAQFGVVWHVNCHSMPSTVTTLPGSEPLPRVDFVLGDRDGTTCEPDFVRFVAHTLESSGYRVAINNPYKGVELIRRYADPTRGRHSLQLEINRRLYMNEDTAEKHSGFEPLRKTLTHLIRRIADYAGDRITASAAE
jgi:N-formylglutamate amidohydrolase